MTPQRLASLAFFVFVVLQTPCFLLVTDSGDKVEIAPLQLAVTYANEEWGDFFSFLKPWLLPGTYIREAFAPFVRCLIHEKVGCEPFYYQLTDFEGIFKKLTPPELLEVYNQGMKTYRLEGLLGCGVIAVAGSLSAAVPVKLGVLGFLILGYAITMQGLTPLPPFLLMAFLVTFAAIANDVQRHETKKAKAAKAAAKKAAAAPAAPESSTSAEISAAPETKKDK